MMAEISRKAELRRLAAKQGWYDGYDGSGPHPTTKGVMAEDLKTSKQNSVPDDEEQAYWDGYNQGLAANSGAANLYLNRG